MEVAFPTCLVFGNSSVGHAIHTVTHDFQGVHVATRNKKLLGAPGLTTRTLLGAPGIANRNKKLLGAPTDVHDPPRILGRSGTGR